MCFPNSNFDYNKIPDTINEFAFTGFKGTGIVYEELFVQMTLAGIRDWFQRLYNYLLYYIYLFTINKQIKHCCPNLHIESYLRMCLRQTSQSHIIL